MFYFHSHHKCASRWAIAYLREVAGLNFLDFESGDKTENVAKTKAHIAFFGNSSYPRAAAHSLFGVHFIRNPLNIVVSSYFSHLNTHSDAGWDELTAQRQLLRQVDLAEGLDLTVAFLERERIGPGTSGPLFALREWDYADPRFKTVRVEDFVLGPSAAMKELLPMSHPHLPPDWRYSFEMFSGGRQRGQVDDFSHYRSGDPTEWTKYLSADLVRYLQDRFGDLLGRFYPDTSACAGLSSDAPFHSPTHTAVAATI